MGNSLFCCCKSEDNAYLIDDDHQDDLRITTSDTVTRVPSAVVHPIAHISNSQNQSLSTQVHRHKPTFKSIHGLHDASQSDFKTPTSNIVTHSPSAEVHPSANISNVQNQSLSRHIQRHKPTVKTIFGEDDNGQDDLRVHSTMKRQNTSVDATVTRTFSEVVLARDQRRKIPTQRKATHVKLYKPPVNSLVLNLPELSHWAPMYGEIVRRIRLGVDSFEYHNVARAFKHTFYPAREIIYIERVQNPYIYGCYVLKREEMTNYLGYIPTEENLFHGTLERNVDIICTHNFDWRKIKRGKFGNGVSFAKRAYYASHYNGATPIRYTLLVKVLIGNEETGRQGMHLPNRGYDTTTKGNRDVIVKFTDDEFYPAYIICYREHINN